MVNKIKIEINDSTTAFNHNIALEMECDEKDMSVKELNEMALKDLERIKNES